MMLYGVSVLLLISAGYAAYPPPSTGLGQSLTVPSGVEVTSKFLLDGNYLITEVHNPRELAYWLETDGPKLRLRNNNPHKNEEVMFLDDNKRNWLKAGEAITIEGFSYYRRFRFECGDKSLPLGDKDRGGRGEYHCEGNVRLRNQSREEKRQLQQFKREHKEILNLDKLQRALMLISLSYLATKSPFKLVFDNGTIRTQSFGIKFDLKIELGHEGDSFLLTVTDSKTYSTIGFMWIRDKKLLESSFTIEAFPEGTKGVDCYGNHPYLDPISCSGHWTIY